MYPKDSSLACDQGFALSREPFGSIQSVQFFNGAKPCESLFLAWPRPRCLGFPRPLASVALGLEGFGDFSFGGFDGFCLGGFGFEGLNGCSLGGLGF